MTNSHHVFKSYIKKEFEFKVLIMIRIDYNILNKLTGKNGGKDLYTVECQLINIRNSRVRKSPSCNDQNN